MDENTNNRIFREIANQISPLDSFSTNPKNKSSKESRKTFSISLRPSFKKKKQSSSKKENIPRDQPDDDKRKWLDLLN